MAPMPERFGGGAIVNFFHTKITYHSYVANQQRRQFSIFFTPQQNKKATMGILHRFYQPDAPYQHCN